MLLISGAFAVVLGGITIWLRNPLFLQWKPTVVYWIFAIVLLAMDFFSPRNLFARTLGENMNASRRAWRILNAAWVAMFAIMGVVNIYVAYNYEMSTWVDFKLYLAIASLVFGFGITAGFLFRYMPREDENDAAKSVENASDADGTS